MNNEQHRSLAIQALGQMRGDDLYRARAAFRGMTTEQMKEPHGQSGKSRAEVLREYEDHDARIAAAIEWLKSLT